MTDSLKYAIEDMEIAAQRGDKYDALTSGAWTKGIIPYTFDSSFSKSCCCCFYSNLSGLFTFIVKAEEVYHVNSKII